MPNITAPAGARLDTAVEQAEAAFWEAVASHYPEVKTGDAPPDAVIRQNHEHRRNVKQWLIDNWPMPAVGTRVRTTREIDRHPFGVIPAGWEGTVTDGDDGVDLSVLFDRYLGPGFHDWDNNAQWNEEQLLDWTADLEVITTAQTITDIASVNGVRIDGADTYNERNADRGMAAVIDHTDKNYRVDGRKGLEIDMADLIANLMHLCDRFAIRQTIVMERAWRVFQQDRSAHPPVVWNSGHLATSAPTNPEGVGA